MNGYGERGLSTSLSQIVTTVVHFLLHLWLVGYLCSCLGNRIKLANILDFFLNVFTCLFLEISNLLNCIYGVIDEAHDILNDMKNKDTFKSPHSNGLCDPSNLVEAFKEIARHLALGIVSSKSFAK